MAPCPGEERTADGEDEAEDGAVLERKRSRPNLRWHDANSRVVGCGSHGRLGAGVLSERVHARLRSRTFDELSRRFPWAVPALGWEPEALPCRVPDGRARNLGAVCGTEVNCGTRSITGTDPSARACAGRRL